VVFLCLMISGETTGARHNFYNIMNRNKLALIYCWYPPHHISFSILTRFIIMSFFVFHSIQITSSIKVKQWILSKLSLFQSYNFGIFLQTTHHNIVDSISGWTCVLGFYKVRGHMSAAFLDRFCKHRNTCDLNHLCWTG
jgi:hypothetical protein